MSSMSVFLQIAPGQVTYHKLKSRKQMLPKPQKEKATILRGKPTLIWLPSQHFRGELASKNGEKYCRIKIFFFNLHNSFGWVSLFSSVAAPCYSPPPVNYLGLVWGRTWLPAAAPAGCHTVKDPFINKLSICCQQPPFGLFWERSCGVESWLDQLEKFKGKKKGKRQMSSSLFSATDLGYGVGFRREEGEFKGSVKEEAANRKVRRARRRRWEKQASCATGFWVMLVVAMSLPQRTAQNQALNMVRISYQCDF